MTSTVATQEDLERLGLAEFRVGDSAELTWPTSDTSQALGPGVVRATFVAMLAARFVNVPFAAVSDAALGRFQLEISQIPTRVLRVSAPRETSIQLYALRGSLRPGETTYAPPEDPGTIYIDAESLPSVIVRAGEAGLAIGATGQALELVELLKPIELTSLERLEPAVMEWARELNDPWLVDQVEGRAHAHNSWSRIVAAGMLARLPLPATKGNARAWVENFTAGRLDAVLAEPRRWVRALNEQQTRSIERQSIAEVDALYDAVESVASEVDSNAPHWTVEWRELCHRRDDVECVLVLLDEVGKAVKLRHSLLGLDKEGDLLRLSVPSGSLKGDERARRAALRNPSAWWGELVALG
jgi:hypothetical protein